MLCTNLNKREYFYKQPTFGNVNVSPNVLKTIEKVPCPICGGEILTLDKIHRWLIKSSKYTGENLSKLLYDSFLVQPLERIEAKVAQGCYEIITNSQRKMEFKDAVEILKERSRIDGEQGFCKMLEESIEFTKKSEMPKNVKQKLFSWYDSLFTEVETGESLPKLFRFWEDNVNRYQSGQNGLFYREAFVKGLLHLDPIGAAGIFFTETRNTFQIAKTLVQPYLPTFDHIVPKSKGGQNWIYNYIPMHKGCNEERSTQTWHQLVSFGVTTIKKIQNFVDTMLQAIRSGNVNGLEEDYIERIVDHLNYQLSGDYISYKI